MDGLEEFEILEAAVHEGEGDPRWTNFRHIWMVAGIKADLAALGIKDAGD